MSRDERGWARLNKSPCSTRGAAARNHAHCYIGKVCWLLLVRADYIRPRPRAVTTASIRVGSARVVTASSVNSAFELQVEPSIFTMTMPVAADAVTRLGSETEPGSTIARWLGTRHLSHSQSESRCPSHDSGGLGPRAQASGCSASQPGVPLFTRWQPERGLSRISVRSRQRRLNFQIKNTEQACNGQTKSWDFKLSCLWSDTVRSRVFVD